MMILPNKHVGLSGSGLGVGAILLKELTEGLTISMLWESVREKTRNSHFRNIRLELRHALCSGACCL